MAAGLQVRAERLDGFRAALVGARARLPDARRTSSKVEHVDAVVPGDALGLDLAEELQALRPFGMGNPGDQRAGARGEGLRRAADGRRAATCASPSPPAALRSRAVGFGIAPGSGALGNGDTRHDLAARLEANEWQGAVEPRLVVRSLHPVEDKDDCDGAAAARLHVPDGRRRVVERGLELPTRRPSPRPCELRTANREPSSTAAAKARSACSAT